MKRLLIVFFILFAVFLYSESTAQWDTADADNVLTFQQGWMTFKN